MNKRLLVAGFPKSGNTWLGYMLSYLLNAKYTDLHVPDQPPTGQAWVLQLICGGLDHESDFSEVNKTHHPPYKVQNLQSYDHIIHIIRDPRDVAVSYFFFNWYNLPLFRGKKLRPRLTRITPLRFLIWKTTLLRTAYQWKTHSLSWLSQNVHQVRYEDLVSNSVAELNAICKRLDAPIDNALLNDAIDRFSFNRLSGGRAAGSEDKYHFFRKGIIGDHKNYFDSADKLMLSLICKKTMRRFQYERGESQK
jgi:hypothetical protein